MFRLLSPLLFLSFAFTLPAQDPVLSQFFANRIYLNPAFAGLEKGLQFNVSARNQWYSADRGYSFVAASAEWQEPCWRSGFGLTVGHAVEGLAPLSSSNAALTYSYNPIQTDDQNLHLGLQYAYNQKRLDWSRLTFSDQLDPVFGSIYPTAAQAVTDVVQFHDFAFGGVYRWNTRMRTSGAHMFRFRSHLGVAIHHLASLVGQGPDESFLHTNAEVPARITLHGGTIIPFTFLQGVGNRLIISPNFRLESQGAHPLNFGKSLTLFSGGVYVIFLNRFTTGLLYHSRSPLPAAKNTNSVTLSAGFSAHPQDRQGDNFYIGLSVDANASGLGFRSNNVYEVNLRYAFQGLRTFCDRGHRPFKPGSGPMECPHFAY